MPLKTKVLRGSAVLSLNEAVGSVCSLVRNYILARVLSKDDFGIAATLTVAFLFLEIISKMAFGQQVIVSKHGGDRLFIDTGHTIQLIIGFLSAAIFLVIARPLAGLLAVPQLAEGLRLLALVPACMALGHLGAYTYAREVHFERSVCLEAIPQILITLAAWPIAVWLQDFRAFIWIQIGKAALSTLVSYLVGGSRYAFGFRKNYCREIIRYSWPLIVSGLIMLCSSQGDRLMMTRAYSMKDLGTYAVAWSLAATPCFAMMKIVGGISLPMLAQAADDHALLRTRYALVAQVFSLYGALFTIGMAVCGEDIMRLLFGNKYAGTGALAAWLAYGQAVRIIRGAPSGVAWARGETTTQMIGTVVRLLGLILVVPVLVFKGSLYWVAAAGIVGEVLALATQVVEVRRRHRMETGWCFGPALAGTACAGLGAIAAHWLVPGGGLMPALTLLITLMGLTLFVFGRIFPEIGGELGRLWSAAEARLVGTRTAC